jgi:membrane-associated protease RseP (regulator of RpoE activity)
MSDPTSTLSVDAGALRPVQVWVAHPPNPRYWLHALLLLLTVFTTLVVGAHMQNNFQHNRPVLAMGDDPLAFFPLGWILQEPSRLLLGVPFSATLMLILLAHEMGHYLYCRRYGVYATLPFFIPAPTLIGTLGAFIWIRSPIRSRTALFDIGIAGPIAGFALAVPIMLVSLALSKPLTSNPAGISFELGYPLIFQLGHRVMGAFAVGLASRPLEAVNLHPTAIAAWIGMFATALNLMPGGQFDGGHIVFSIWPRAHKFISRLTILVLLPLAYYCWVGWLIWAILLEISSMRHPRVAEYPRVSGSRTWLAVFGLLMLVLTLTPAPFSNSSLHEVILGLRQEFRGR